jgi:hypothetical protein
MATDYIPRTDAGVRTWAYNFSTLITATPGAYGLMASDATTIAAAFNLFDAALTLVQNPLTKTKATVADKDAKKAAMLVTLRQYAQTIKRNLGVSNEAKIGLGLHINDSPPSPIPAPVTVPVLEIASDVPLVQSVVFHDSSTPERRGKPAGVTGMMLAVAVGTTPPASPADTPVLAVATRSAHRVTFQTADKGKTAYYYGRWMTASGQVGPWSAMAQLSIAG